MKAKVFIKNLAVAVIIYVVAVWMPTSASAGVMEFLIVNQSRDMYSIGGNCGSLLFDMFYQVNPQTQFALRAGCDWTKVRILNVTKNTPVPDINVSPNGYIRIMIFNDKEISVHYKP